MDYKIAPSPGDVSGNQTTSEIDFYVETEKGGFCSQTKSRAVVLFLCVVCLGSILLNLTLFVKYWHLEEQLTLHAKLLERVSEKVSEIAASKVETHAEWKDQVFDGNSPHGIVKRRTGRHRRNRGAPVRRRGQNRSRRHSRGRRCRCKTETVVAAVISVLNSTQILEDRVRVFLQNNPNILTLTPNPVTHLKGRNGALFPVVDSPFPWQQPDLQFGSTFTYEWNGNNVTGIQIQVSGTYLVYSQTAVHGTTLQVSKPDCGHETVRVAMGDENNRVVLGKSLVTQDQRGSHYDDNDQLKPLDTIFQMGVFALELGDKIYVRKTELCPYGFIMHPHYTYFGAILLNRAF